MNPKLLTTILAIPTIGANLYVAKDYLNISKKQEKEETKEETTPFEEMTASLEEIAQKREKLISQKEELKELKSRQEIFHDLFDTEFYLEHKDDRLKTLLYKR